MNASDAIEFKFRLRLYKSKVHLMMNNVKQGKKEVKSAIEIYSKEMKVSTSNVDKSFYSNSTASDDEEDEVDTEESLNDLITSGKANW